MSLTAHKSKVRGRERKVYIDQELDDQINLMFLNTYKGKPAYGLFNQLVNDALRVRVREMQAGMIQPAEMKLLVGTKGGETQNAYTKLRGLILEILPEIKSLMDGKHSGIQTVLKDWHYTRITAWYERLTSAAQDTLKETDLLPKPAIAPPKAGTTELLE